MILNASGEIIARADPAAGLLAYVDAVQLGAAGRFASAEKFREGEEVDGVEVHWVGSDFERNFLGKTELTADPVMVSFSKLKERSKGVQLLMGANAALCDVSLSQFWELLKRQGKGQEGPLLINHAANVLFVRSAHGELRVVDAYFQIGFGWYFGSRSVESPLEFEAGSLFIHRR